MLRTQFISVAIALLVSNTLAASASVRLPPIERGYISLDPRDLANIFIPDPYQVRSSRDELNFTGQEEMMRRGFLYFDLTSISDPVISATLRFRVGGLDTGPPDNRTAGVSLFDVTSTAEMSGGERYEDLGSGIQYGGRSIHSSAAGSVVGIDLNSTAVAHINSATDTFGMGMTAGLYWFQQIRTSEHELELELETTQAAVPEPTSLFIFAAYACFGLVVLSRQLRRNRVGN